MEIHVFKATITLSFILDKLNCIYLCIAMACRYKLWLIKHNL